MAWTKIKRVAQVAPEGGDATPSLDNPAAEKIKERAVNAKNDLDKDRILKNGLIYKIKAVKTKIPPRIKLDPGGYVQAKNTPNTSALRSNAKR